MKAQLQLIHLQLTLKCNLNCSFCGQWGKKGFMHGKSAPELSLSEWLKIIEEIRLESAKQQVTPEFIIWGGEPLVSPCFSNIVKTLKSNGAKISLITNGVLLEQFYEVINDTVDTVFVSLDGPEAIHDKIRGRKGIYRKIVAGIKRLDPAKVKIINLLTICEDNIDKLTEFPVEVDKIGFSGTMYQNLIYCNSDQSESYAEWLQDDFNQDTQKLNSWVTNKFGDWINKLPAIITEIQKKQYPVKVELFPYELNGGNILDWFNPQIEIKDESEKCLMPYRHLNINPDGSTHFCVDFNDFTLGNVAVEGVYKLFYSRKAEKFRQGCNPLCKRCPWFYNKLTS